MSGSDLVAVTKHFDHSSIEITNTGFEIRLNKIP